MPFEHPLYSLYRELRLRLENTPKRLALVVVLKAPADLEPTLLSLRALFSERLGKRWIELATEITPDGDALLYGKRGHDWKSVYVNTTVFDD